MKYEKDLMAAWDEYAIKKSLLEEGKEKGKKEGIKEGFQKGKERKSYEVVRNLITKMGLTDSQVADIAGVTVNFVKKVRKELKK